MCIEESLVAVYCTFIAAQIVSQKNGERGSKRERKVINNNMRFPIYINIYIYASISTY